MEAVMDNEMNHGYYVEMLDNNLDTFSLLMNLDSVLWNQTEQPLSVSDFFEKWKCGARKSDNYNINLGMNLIRTLYCGIVIPCEKYKTLLPQISMDSMEICEWFGNDSSWKIKVEERNLKNCMKRIRNAVAHFYVDINFPEEYTAASRILKNTTVVLKDRPNEQKPFTFEARFTIDQLIKIMTRIADLIKEYDICEKKRAIKERMVLSNGSK